MKPMNAIKASLIELQTVRLRYDQFAATIIICSMIVLFFGLSFVAKARTGEVQAPSTFADLVEKVKPAVVSIRVSSKGAKRLSQKEGRRGLIPFPDLPRDHPLNEFFRNLPRGTQNGPAPQRRLAQGSGFVISADGFVVTNNHVIRGGDQIIVTSEDEKKYDAELIGSDARTDLALLKIKSSKSFPYVKFAKEQSRVFYLRKGVILVLVRMILFRLMPR